MSVWQMFLCTSSRSLMSALCHSCWVRWPNPNTHLGQTLNEITVLCLGWRPRIPLSWEEISHDWPHSCHVARVWVAGVLGRCTVSDAYFPALSFSACLCVQCINCWFRCTKGFLFLFEDLLKDIWFIGVLCPPPLPIVFNSSICFIIFC